MYFLALYLFLCFSPGLRGISFFYYPFLILSLFLTLYSIPRYSFNRFSLRRASSLPILILILLYLLIILSLFSVDDKVLLPELLVSLARFSLPVFIFSFFFLYPRSIFFHSLYIAVFASVSLAAFVLYAQGLSGVPFDFLNSSAHERASLSRYASTMGSLTAASLGIPLSCFTIYFMNTLIPNSFAYRSKLVSFLSGIPPFLYIPIFLFSLIFTLSRTALFSSILLLFVLYGLPVIRKFYTCRFKFTYTFRPLFFFWLALLFCSMAVLYNKFLPFFDVLYGFIDSSGSEALQSDGVVSLLDDVVERLLWFDDGAFEVRRLILGGGYHHVSGSLGIVSAGRFSHNTFLDLFHVLGLIGPTLLLVFFLAPLRVGLSNLFSVRFYSPIVSASNLGFCLLMIPNFLTFSGAIYVPLFMTPIFALFFVNTSLPRPAHLS